MLFRRRLILFDAVDWRLQLPWTAAQEICKRLLHGSEQPSRFLIRVGSNNINANHRVRTVELFRWLELFPVDLEGIEQSVWREV